MSTRPRHRESVLPAFDCACATVRRAARLVTQLYDEELRPHIEVPQFALLSALERHPDCTQSALARGAGFDKTTISRNLALMRRKGWIEDVQSDDPRDHPVRITAAGRELLRTAKPGWSRAQKRLSAAMAPDEWAKMWVALDRLTNAAVKAREKKGVR
jgi:DNA-binding MarR family transcriptional regulator